MSPGILGKFRKNKHDIKKIGCQFNVELLNKNVVLFLQVFQRERERERPET